MMAAIRAAILKPQDCCSYLKTAFFHSTSILQRKHQSNSKARSKRLGRKKAKQDLRRNVNAFAQHLFGIWSDGFDYSGKHTSWFEKQYSRVSKRNRNGKRHIPQHLDKRCFDFSEVDDGYEIEYFLRTALGGSRGFSWSSRREEGGTRSGRYSNNFRKSWGSRYRLDEEEEEEEDKYSSTESSDTEPNQESHRQALGLSSSGPLNLEDVKIAYRACALKWHPDRHHTSTKNEAEEKFQLCTVAYQSLCEKLAMN
ncbi:Chaperone J-domain superfamily [Arabidopsis thaliana x Arabidopsis arenosa]|uniref:Chaperone J-domain superfamily n=1 Tax=Arabidopsis thaliana x Arabidopsis arenosa TaxID=1240361 RepID=A0A8T1ZPD5_9BRAS|nr:Chaperone J-domain superfamily [Arabidopsis thaliana x Arabidopsis arenosa]